MLKYKCYCSYIILSFFHTSFIVAKYEVLLLMFTSNHSLYSRILFYIIISFSQHNSPTKILFQQYNIPPFKKLVFHRLGLQLYKYEFGIIPIAIRSLFTKNSSVHNYNTRNSNKLIPALARYAYRDKVIIMTLSLYMCRTIYVTMLVSMCLFPRLRNLSNVSFYTVSDTFSFKS